LAQPEQVPAGPAAPRRRTPIIIAGCVVVVLLVAGGIASALLLNDKGSPTAATTPAPTATAASAAPTPSPTRYAGELQDLAIPMPAGATRQTLRMGRDDGSLDLDAVLLEYEEADEPAMRKQLTELEFQRGLFLAWNDAQGFLVYLQIWQFRYEREAAAWSVAEARGLSASAESTASLDDILGGKVIVTTAPNGRSAAHARFPKGDLAIMLSIFKAGPTDLDYLKRLAAEQYQRLP
jgi:hypothetical protein